MRIKVLFNKEAENSNLRIGWGVSFLVDQRILFDTGKDGAWLMENMGTLRVEVDKIEAVVISHDHWDHTGGLWNLLKKKKGLKVYSCPGFSEGFKENVEKGRGVLQETNTFMRVAQDIYATGEIAGEYQGGYMPEQALAVKTEKGISIITGCAHPGIVTMVEKVRGKFKDDHIYSVIGGFHLLDQDRRTVEMIADTFRKMDIEKAGPTHCSGEAAEDIFKKIYGSDFIELKVGQSLDI
ncbi:MAG: MBL fold metallo-hydrolase [Candidatus Omnitrophica bacterium]|nr:MBL fold metallo-hydrolase [Candidatus Omnitrophota bacterium]